MEKKKRKEKSIYSKVLENNVFPVPLYLAPLLEVDPNKSLLKFIILDYI